MRKPFSSRHCIGPCACPQGLSGAGSAEYVGKAPDNANASPYRIAFGRPYTLSGAILFSSFCSALLGRFSLLFDTNSDLVPTVANGLMLRAAGSVKLLRDLVREIRGILKVRVAAEPIP